MTTFLTRRRRPATAPRRRILSVTDHWSLVDGEMRRDVLVQLPGGQLVVEHLADEHPALVRYLEHAAAVAA